jgi:hypothetical protein
LSRIARPSIRRGGLFLLWGEILTKVEAWLCLPRAVASKANGLDGITP